MTAPRSKRRRPHAPALLAVLVSTLLLLVGKAAAAAPTYFADRAVFEAAFQDLPLEDFEDLPVDAGDAYVCDATTVSSESDLPCAGPGVIAAGMTVSSSGILVVAGAGFLNHANASRILAPQYAAAYVQYDFATPLLYLGAPPGERYHTFVPSSRRKDGELAVWRYDYQDPALSGAWDRRFVGFERDLVELCAEVRRRATRAARRR